MQEIFETTIVSLLVAFTVIYAWHKLVQQKLDFKSPRLYLVYILFIFSNFASGYIFSTYVRLILLFFVWVLLHQILFRTKLKKSIICIIETQVIMLVIEALGILLAITMFQVNIEVLQSNAFLKLLPNIIISLLTFIVFSFRFPVTIMKKVLNITDHLRIRYIIIFVLLLIICINVILGITYYQNLTIMIVVVEGITLSIYTVISILMLKEKNTSEIYRIGYEEQQKALQDNVLLLDQECMKNHENVNQLYTIEGLARNNDTKGILEYIGVVIKEKKQEDNTLTRRIKRIPLATIQGLIYPKLGIMKDNDIDFQVVLARNIKEFDFTKVDMKTNMELCKILGVLIDNAIDEVTKLEDRKIKLELFCKNGNLHIDVSNNYGKLLDNMDEVGVTSKEGLHGYGLGIIAQITKQNPKLQNQKNINANRFHQIVVVSNSIDNKKKNV